ncbi:hypothetical protein DSO57_1008700 [Entomophthora muscae]|uniref:Uncharacterized protein n=1 Tax=Entomophthora muscae TaxID=34485 RepID=A0ACC2SW85_9FUNG|nr:hypothetical protein DSO57_1008700 [Entomophthora muscae]
MATPHVAGLAAYFLSQESATPSELAAKIVSLSSKDAIANCGSGSPNLFVYNNIA